MKPVGKYFLLKLRGREKPLGINTNEDQANEIGRLPASLEIRVDYKQGENWDFIQRVHYDREEADTLVRGKPESIELELDKLRLGVYTPRLEVMDNYVTELAESMAREGQYQPIIVRKTNNEYAVIDGEHRYRAAAKLGWKKLRCQVYDIAAKDAEIKAIRINMVHGKGLQPIEEARKIVEFLKQGYTHDYIAREIFYMSITWVKEREHLIQRSEPKLIQALEKGEIEPKKILDISKLAPRYQEEVMRLTRKHDLPRAKVQELVQARFDSRNTRQWKRKAGLIISGKIEGVQKNLICPKCRQALVLRINWSKHEVQAEA